MRVTDTPIRIRRVKASDVAKVIALDARVTGLPKSTYWRDLFARFGRRRLAERFFLVAEPDAAAARTPLLGFIIGEVRAWEFGSAPCGWVFGLAVDPDRRLEGVGEKLFEAISAEFRKAGMDKMRTMVARDNLLPLRFFRGEGMMAGPYIQLEKDLE
ncbi:MAG: N-acetyltransferase [Bradyrhizobiaceae bacterium]|nr:MAG: N-acetyltransferase [Bradyrhizobiaceae bacterium]